MFAWINQYSYVIIAIVLMAIIGFGSSRVFSWKVSMVIVLILIIVFTAFLRSQSVKNIGIETKSDWDKLLDSKVPVVLQLYSDY
mgnify:CR=1 FL=1